jgi:hypothetical protein
MSPPIQHRLITCLQRRGNLGKSTALAAFAQFCDQRQVSWRGFDLDADHRSFSRLFPEQVSLRELGDEPEGEIIKIVRACSEVPVTIIDPRAHIADAVFRGWEMIQFPQHFATTGGRITILLFPGDDLEILTDIDALATRLDDSVDYVIVRNPARQPRCRMFDGSELESDLGRLGAVTLEIPTLLALARNHLAALEAELGRGITPVEAVANRELALDGMVRMVVEDWIKTLFRRFDAIAGQLLPAAYAAKIARVDAAPPATALRTTRGAKINRQNL